MSAPHDITLTAGPPNASGGSIRFCNHAGVEMLRLNPSGVHEVSGRVVAHDQLVYQAFRLWLQGALAGVRMES